MSDARKQIKRADDPDVPDETEGRKLYRLRADALARLQVNYAKRKVQLEKTP